MGSEVWPGHRLRFNIGSFQLGAFCSSKLFPVATQPRLRINSGTSFCNSDSYFQIWFRSCLHPYPFICIMHVQFDHAFASYRSVTELLDPFFLALNTHTCTCTWPRALLRRFAIVVFLPNVCGSEWVTANDFLQKQPVAAPCAVKMTWMLQTPWSSRID